MSNIFTTQQLTQPMPTAQLSLRTRQRYAAAAFVATIVGLAIVAALLHRGEAAPASAASPGPIVILATAAPPVDAARVRYITAWAAPGGDVLGPIPEPHSFTARYGDGWLAVAWENGTVWVRVADLLNAPADLANLAPEPTAPTGPSAPEPAQAPVIMAAPATFAPPEPTAEQAKRDSTGQKYSGETWHPPMVVQNACAGWHPPMAPIAGCP